MTTHSAEFQAFLASLDAPIRSPADLEDFDLRAYAALDAAEREETEQVLIARLAGPNDPRVPRALAGSGSPLVIQALLQALSRPYPDHMAIEAACALLDGAHRVDALAAIVRAVHDGIDESARLRAIEVLASRVGESESADSALLQAIEADVSPGARAMAQEALFQRHKLSVLAAVPRSRLRRIGTLLLNPLAAAHTQALADLTQIVTDLRAGKSPEALGLVSQEIPESTALTRFQDSVSNEKKNAALDLDAFQQLAGDERAWAEVLILFLLGKADARAISACATLHLTMAEPALRELAARADSTALLARKALIAL